MVPCVLKTAMSDQDTFTIKTVLEKGRRVDTFVTLGEVRLEKSLLRGMSFFQYRLAALPDASIQRAGKLLFNL